MDIKTINKIKELKQKGKSEIEVSRELKIPPSSISYYYNSNTKKRIIEYGKKYKKLHPPKRGEKYRKYQREYHRRYYEKNKENLRAYQREKSKEYYKKKK